MAEDFEGNERFQILRRLGAGGMGVVYEAFDRKTQSRVALKVLKNRAAEDLMRLKREFRAAADLNHRNLVSLYELDCEGEEPFFTLELIDGPDFIQYVRPQAAGLADAPTGGLDQTVRTPSGRDLGVEEGRLRPALEQLARGVAAIHASGRVHRDLKPSNVLVTGEGRVVILDFGLATELDGERSISELQGAALVGTFAYMAPEQGAALTQASDWYAFGCILYQALTGHLPYEGSATEVLIDKERRAPVPPSQRARGVPTDLDQLCVDLLRREPAQRPSAEEVLRRLGAAAPEIAAPRRSSFIGREAELARLDECLERSRAGRPQIVSVTGQSGIGKTALVRRFLERAQAKGAVVLAGRCHEREWVPFKALDSAVDALVRHLASLGPERVDALLPRDAWALARMFPALNRVDAFARAKVKEVEVGEQRRRATAALRELVGRMTDRTPLVIFIDDLQWGDDDSAVLLSELLRGDDAPALVLVGAAREPVPLPEGSGAQRTEIALAPLSQDDSLALARLSLPEAEQGRAERVARESGGNPFLLQQLAQYAGQEEVGVDGLVMARAKNLPEEARRLLELVAVAGRPTRQTALLAVAGLKAPDEALRELRAAQLVRSDGDRLEVTHDRIRDTVTESVPMPRQEELHRRLAEALEGQGEADLDAIAFHLTAARDHARAAVATARAAKRAAEALAFEQAATLYRAARDGLPPADPRRREFTKALADALAEAGRGGPAAQFYREALDEPGPEPLSEGDALELRRCEAEQLLRIGHVDEGMEAIREVLAEERLSLPRGPVSTFAVLLARRAALGLRGMEFTRQDEAKVDRETLRRIDVCWSASVGLAMVDTLRGATVGAKQLQLALEAGEPHRVARALAAEAAFGASVGRRGEVRAKKLLERARKLAAEVGDGKIAGLVEFCAGLSAFMGGRFAEAKALHDVAEQRFQELGATVTWEASTARMVNVWSMVWLGDLIEVFTRRLPAMLAEARLRGDRYTVTGLQSGLAIMESLALDEPERARTSVHEVLAGWSKKSFQFQHYWSLLSEGMIDLYVGEPEPAFQRMVQRWGALRSSLFLSIQLVRVEARYLRGRAALATGRLGEALGDAERMEGEGVEYGRALAACLRAGVAHARGMPQRATQLYARALELFDASQMRLYATAARARLGELQGGELGAANVRAADAWLRAQGVRKPDRMIALMIPLPPGGNGRLAT